MLLGMLGGMGCASDFGQTEADVPTREPDRVSATPLVKAAPSRETGEFCYWPAKRNVAAEAALAADAGAH